MKAISTIVLLGTLRHAFANTFGRYELRGVSIENAGMKSASTFSGNFDALNSNHGRQLRVDCGCSGSYDTISSTINFANLVDDCLSRGNYFCYYNSMVSMRALTIFREDELEFRFVLTD